MVSFELEARLDNLLATAQEETSNIDLFAPIQEKEECPICMITLPIHEEEISFSECCGKYVCSGCVCENIKTYRNQIERRVITMEEFKCAFCRQPPPKNTIKALKKLMKKNNTQAFLHMAGYYERGDGVMQSDIKALEMRIRAAELGNAQAYTLIAYQYDYGNLVGQNTPKVFEFLEIAAKKRSIPAQYACYIWGKFWKH